MGDNNLEKNEELSDDQKKKLKELSDNLQFVNNYLKNLSGSGSEQLYKKYSDKNSGNDSEELNIYKKLIIDNNNYYYGFYKTDNDRINFIFSNILLLNSNTKNINAINPTKYKNSTIKILYIFDYDVNDYSYNATQITRTEEVKFKSEFDDILDYLIAFSVENREAIEKIIEENGENTSEGGNKKTKKSDKYTVKQLKTLAFVYNVKSTKKSNGKIVNLKSDELLTKLKKSKIIL
jgi:hypothetical protein